MVQNPPHSAKLILIKISNQQGPAHFPLLPKGNMLLLDRIVEIASGSGKYNKGHAIAKLDIHPELWFFKCHFSNDPIMPGSLGIDGLSQLLGFYLGWLGCSGKGRALGIGKIRYKNEVTPDLNDITYSINLKQLRLAPEFSYAIADGEIYGGKQLISMCHNLSVGIKAV